MAVYSAGLFWGCPQMNFKANPPFNEMKQDFATFKKETRMAPWILNRKICPNFLGICEKINKKQSKSDDMVFP
jgi:hypothetical protein